MLTEVTADPKHVHIVFCPNPEAVYKYLFFVHPLQFFYSHANQSLLKDLLHKDSENNQTSQLP